MPEMGVFATAVAAAVRTAAREAGVTQVEMARVLGRAQSYVSVRWSGRKAWTLDELDVIAPLVGVTSALALIVRGQ